MTFLMKEMGKNTLGTQRRYKQACIVVLKERALVITCLILLFLFKTTVFLKYLFYFFSLFF